MFSEKATRGCFCSFSWYIDLAFNNATEKELQALNGIGEALAKRIVEYRKTNKFNTIEDIMKVSGIADGRFQQIKDDISVN